MLCFLDCENLILFIFLNGNFSSVWNSLKNFRIYKRYVELIFLNDFLKKIFIEENE